MEGDGYRSVLRVRVGGSFPLLTSGQGSTEPESILLTPIPHPLFIHPGGLVQQWPYRLYAAFFIPRFLPLPFAQIGSGRKDIVRARPPNLAGTRETFRN